MPVDPTVVGREGPERTRHWSSADALLYAVGVGAGMDDPTNELAFTTENSTGVEQRVLPTFGVLLAHAPLPPLGHYDPARLVHAEQSLTLSGPIPTEGTVRARTRVTDVYDKGSGALVVVESTATLPDGQVLVATRSAVFLRGEGGFGGERGPRDTWAVPEREPDRVVTYPTRPEQALLYRLSGDRNPLHADPAFAARAGFDRPILHGLCTYGVTGRALLHEMAGSDPARLRTMSGRFSATVTPGQSLTVEMWAQDDTVLFRTRADDGTVVIDRGQATVSKLRESRNDHHRPVGDVVRRKCCVVAGMCDCRLGP
ncbi:MaoC/PaaZ C-terminal domain-containing protein [Asanoa iriomotensis]|uniref:3-alpha,7-alpha, 12-alpha-trihydroxy-5-beta-choles t-24-enoyl-CoA hydratase n=1 Tax=Asanoa iriomotensis TaxID=234613 RepID=A0ABQ4C1F1_9ACTN|nr:MaoC/PaaZ C-terminal domain-containing protein [Asanoa iriomotensis]GIF56598.1 3-alpha,7-alpha,12-alpha-trihydroxy-5-beta-choles t-24-enoyl-CoA hydratase [Asanoa iriomotensis]